MRAVSVLLLAALVAVAPAAAEDTDASSSPQAPAAEEPAAFGFEHLAALRGARDAVLHPDGTRVAYLSSVPRTPGVDPDGGAHTEVHVVGVDGTGDRVWLDTDVSPSSLSFTPDGEHLLYLARRGGDEHTTLYALPLAGGESVAVAHRAGGIRRYALSDDGTTLALVGTPPTPEAVEADRAKGYTEKVWDEDGQPATVSVVPFTIPTPTIPTPGVPEEPPPDAEPLPAPGTVTDVHWMPDGEHLLVSTAPTLGPDASLMFKELHLMDADDGAIVATIPHEGKRGGFLPSPDGAHVAFRGSDDIHDPRDGRLLVAPPDGTAPRDLLPRLEGHLRTFTWVDADTVLYLADVGLHTQLGLVDLDGDGPTVLSTSDGTEALPLWRDIALSEDGTRLVGLASTVQHPTEVYTLPLDVSAGTVGAPARLTDHNPWLAELPISPAEAYTWRARDGLQIEGVYVPPLAPVAGDPPPLVLLVHGGPESHVRLGWNTVYSRPAQVLAAAGFAVLYPNYRGSTGRGVGFSKLSQGDPGGKEFDDLVDAVRAMARDDLADDERVGISGGSYGGYATAWASTKLTKHFQAGVMFVGISNQLSKAYTTDIPREMELVHQRMKPWAKVPFRWSRSPVAHVRGAQTPLLIAGGASDPRVHPSESLQLYRALKLQEDVPVRYVSYPGEGHGNRRAASRDDYARRLVRWMEHFLIDGADTLPPRRLWPDEAAEDGASEEDGSDEAASAE